MSFLLLCLFCLSFSTVFSVCTTPLIYNTTTMELANCQDQIYTITLSIGTPRQQFNFQFDTGSTLLWVPTNSISNPGFNAGASTTFVGTTNTTSISYADSSSVSGTLAFDVVSSVSSSGISVPKNIFLLVNKQQPSVDFYPPGVQGLIGMGDSTLPNFLDLAYQNGQISSPVFSLAIRFLPTRSYLYFNQNNSDSQAQTYYVNAQDPPYWQLRLIKFSAGGTDLTSFASSLAIIDSGTSLFYLNPTLYTQLVNKYFNSCLLILNVNVCNCNAVYPLLTFSFIGAQVSIPSSAYIKPVIGGCTYTFGVLSTLGSVILLGDTFFNAYTITFDKPNKRIGFEGSTAIKMQIMYKGIFLTLQLIMIGVIAILIIIGMALLFQRLQSEQKVVQDKIPNQTHKELKPVKKQLFT